MDIRVAKNAQEWVAMAADTLQEVVQSKPDPVLMLPTGSTPIALYEELVERYKRGEFSMGHVITMNLDEYVGLSQDDEQSYHYFMQKHLFDHVDIPKEHTFIPRTDIDPHAACAEYDEVYRQFGPADAVFLGLGHNGHIGYNEPGTPFENRTAVVELSQSTLKANEKSFAGRNDMPTTALAVGPAMIMESKLAVMLVRGADKADILNTILTHEITTDIPGTLLQRHPNLRVIADEAAAAKLGDLAG